MAMILESDQAGVRIQIREKKDSIRVATESFQYIHRFFALSKTKQTNPTNHLSDGDWKLLNWKKPLSYYTYTALKQTKRYHMFCAKKINTKPNQSHWHVFSNKQDQHQQNN